MNIAELLQEQANKNPQTTAIIDTHWGRSRITSFAALELAASRAATLLRQSGLKPGDAVLVFVPMSAELYIALLALFRLGLVAVFLDPSAGKNHIDRCCNLYPPQAFIATPKAHIFRLFSPALRRIPLKFAIALPLPGTISWPQRLPPDPKLYPCTAETPALLTFTSGSTGRPKAALRTHGFLLAQYRSLVECLQLQSGEVELAALPIFVLANLASGLTSIIPRGDLRRPAAISARAIARQLKIHQPSRIVAPPAFLERLADYYQQRRLTLPRVEKIFSGGAPVMPKTIAQWQKIAPQAEFTAVYGCTEAEPIACIASSHIQPEDFTAMLQGYGLLTGKPAPAIALRILRQQWGEEIGPYTQAEFTTHCLPTGKTGEIVVSGDRVLPGYLHGYGNPENKFTVAGIPWHRTGDAGYLDDCGRLWLLGRCQAAIKSDRGTLYPFAVEVVASHYPGIHRAAIALWRGQLILAIELSDPKVRIDLDILRKSLARYQIQRIKVCKKLPMDQRHNSKIDYPALLQLLESQFN